MQKTHAPACDLPTVIQFKQPPNCMARPRKPDREKYDQKIEVYVRRETKAWVEHRAATQGLSVSRYMRELINGTNEQGLIVSTLHCLETIRRRLVRMKKRLDQGTECRFFAKDLDVVLAYVHEHGYKLTQAFSQKEDDQPDGAS